MISQIQWFQIKLCELWEQIVGIVKWLMNKLEMVITQKMGESVFLSWDVMVLWLVPFVVKHEDIRLVSIKDWVDDSSCLTHFIVQPLDFVRGKA